MRKPTVVPVYREVLGIAVGDTVTTSYGTGPYTVLSIFGPHCYWENWREIVIWLSPVVSLGLGDADGRSGYIINNVRRTDDGRYLTDGGSEVVVAKPEQRQPCQLALFVAAASSAPPPYPFQESVDYQAGDGRLWRCEACGKDYSTAERHRLRARPACPHCGATWRAIPIINMGFVTGQNGYIRGINL